MFLNFGDTAINMRYFIEEKNVPLVDNVDALISLIKNDGAGKVEPDGMFEPNAMANICKFILQIKTVWVSCLLCLLELGIGIVMSNPK